MAATLTVCSDCREMAENKPHLLHGLGHEHCRDALREERRANRWFVIRISPGGCVTGSPLAGPNTLIEDAHKEFTPRVKDRRAEAAAGWRHELVNGLDWDARAKPCLLGDCTHPHVA